MSEKRAKRRAIRTVKQLKQRLEEGNLVWAVTGNEHGFVEVPGSPTHVYVKLQGKADAVVEAYWEIANPIPGLTVIVEERAGKYYVKEIDRLVGKNVTRDDYVKMPLPYAPPAAKTSQLANADEVNEIATPPRQFPIGYMPSNPSRAEIFRPARHGNSHNWGGDDPVMISLDQILDFRVTPTLPNSRQVFIHGGLLYNSATNTLLRVRPQYYQCEPPEQGVRDFVIFLDKSNDGQLYVTYNDRGNTSVPPVLDIGKSSEYYPIALVTLPADAESIGWEHITDLRKLYYSGGPSPKAVSSHPLSPDDGVHTVKTLLSTNYISSYQLASYQKNESGDLDTLALSLTDEIKQLRKIIEEITGEEHWYLIPVTSIANLLSYLESSDLGIYGRWDFSEGNLALPTNDDSCIDYVEDKLVTEKGIHAYIGKESTGSIYDTENCEKLYLSARGAHVHIQYEDYSKLCNGVRTEFLAFNEFEETSLQLYLNGKLLIPDEEYIIGQWNDSFTLAEAPSEGDRLFSMYIAELV